MKQVHKGDVVGASDFRHRGGVLLQAFVVRGAVGQIAGVQVFVRDGREEHQARRALAVVLLAQRLLNERFEVFLELGQALLAGEGLVVAEEGEDDVGVGFGQPLVGRAEILRTEPDGQLVRREAEVAEGQVELGKTAVKVGLQPAVVLHAVGEGIAEDADVVPLAEFQPGRGGLRRQGGNNAPEEKSQGG